MAQDASNWKVPGLIPGSSRELVEVSLSNTLTAPGAVPSLGDCVCEWVNDTYIVKCFK